jgi:hypothetical protein
MADASVHFLSDFIDSGGVTVSGLIDKGPPDDDTPPEVFRTWPRLNVSRDGYQVDLVQ